MPEQNRNYQQKNNSNVLLEHIQAAEGLMPPQALEVEETVLGAILLEKDAFISVSDMLKAEYFYESNHQRIFDAIVSLFSNEKPIDTLTVAQQMQSDGTLEQVGGIYYLTGLTKKVASAAHLQHHAQIIVQKYIRRRLIEVSSKIQKNSYDEGITIDELVNESESDLFNIVEGQLGKDAKHIKDVLEDSLKSIEKAKENEGSMSGTPSGFTGLDTLTAGWQKTDLVILAARPAMGKTAFVLSMARNMSIEHSQPVAVFSLEMSSTQLVNRLIAAETELGADKLKKGNINESEWALLNEKINVLSQANLFIDDTPSLSVFELRAKCRRLKSQHDIQAVIIDYLQLMTSGERAGSREQEVSTISRSLKAIAKELDVPVIALSQLNRSVESREGKKPQLSDLRESGAIEQDADMVLFIHRPEYYGITENQDGQDMTGVAELIIAKHRNGPTDTVELRFRKELAKFENFDRDFDGTVQSGMMAAGANEMPVAEFDEPPF